GLVGFEAALDIADTANRGHSFDQIFRFSLKQRARQGKSSVFRGDFAGGRVNYRSADFGAHAINQDLIGSLFSSHQGPYFRNHAAGSIAQVTNRFVSGRAKHMRTVNDLLTGKCAAAVAAVRVGQVHQPAANRDSGHQFQSRLSITSHLTHLFPSLSSACVSRPPWASQIELPAGATGALLHRWFAESLGTIAPRRGMVPGLWRTPPGPLQTPILRILRAQPPGRQLRFVLVLFFEVRRQRRAWKNRWQDRHRPEWRSGRERPTSAGRFGILVRAAQALFAVQPL